MPFRKPASGLCPEPRRGRNRRLRPICAHWRAPRGAARRSQPRIIAALTRLRSASRWVLISSVQRCARSCSANRLGASRTSICRDLIERVFAFANASCAQPASRTLAHFCQVCASCDVGLGAGLWHSAPEALSAGQEGFGSCQPLRTCGQAGAAPAQAPEHLCRGREHVLLAPLEGDPGLASLVLREVHALRQAPPRQCPRGRQRPPHWPTVKAIPTVLMDKNSPGGRRG